MMYFLGMCRLKNLLDFSFFSFQLPGEPTKVTSFFQNKFDHKFDYKSATSFIFTFSCF